MLVPSHLSARPSFSHVVGDTHLQQWKVLTKITQKANVQELAIKVFPALTAFLCSISLKPLGGVKNMLHS